MGICVEDDGEEAGRFGVFWPVTAIGGIDVVHVCAWWCLQWWRGVRLRWKTCLHATPDLFPLPSTVTPCSASLHQHYPHNVDMSRRDKAQAVQSAFNTVFNALWKKRSRRPIGECRNHSAMVESSWRCRAGCQRRRGFHGLGFVVFASDSGLA